MAKIYDAKCKSDLFLMQGEATKPAIVNAVYLAQKVKANIGSGIPLPFNIEKLSSPLSKKSGRQ